jgi:mannose/fructose/N-acetylgalactosamine-specific phosphotransferase system component IID
VLLERQEMSLDKQLLKQLLKIVLPGIVSLYYVRTILKLILRKQDVIWTGFVGLSVGISGGVL